METRRPEVDRARQRVVRRGSSRAPPRERRRVPSSVDPEDLSCFRHQRPSTRRYRWASPNRYNFDETQVKGHEKKIPPCRGSGIAEVVERAVSKSVVPLTG